MSTSHPRSMRDGGGDRRALNGAGSADPRFAVPLATNVVVRSRLHAQLTIGLAALVVVAAATVAAVAPAQKASRVDPIVSLRSE